MAGFDTHLRDVVGGRTATALATVFTMQRVGDLLTHYPRKYVPRGGLSSLDDITSGDYVTVIAEVVSGKLRPMRAKHGNIAEIIISDGKHRLPLTFFKQDWRLKQLRPGTRGYFSGTLSAFRGTLQLSHPDCQIFGVDPNDPSAPIAEEATVMPLYPAAKQIPSWRIAMAVGVALDAIATPPDPLPADIRAREGLVSYIEALRKIHRPLVPDDVDEAIRRLKWDEALQLQVVLARRRAEAQAQPAVPRRIRPDGVRAAFEAALPYTLTAGQQEVGAEIDADVAETVPMHRLLAGEVGSGKTVVALRAMLTVVDDGAQAVLLAPTEVLAGQHVRSLRALLGPLGRAGELAGDPAGTRVVLLTGSQGVAERRAARAEVASGSAGIVVGTHALLTEGVEFHDLGLVVVDEQHRFGVEQRAVLRARGREGTTPHLLVMTATPIPRTVAMTVFGDLVTSQLVELPRGRQEIVTFVVPDSKPHWIERMWAKVRGEVAAGRQAYVVCPRIEAGEPEAPPARMRSGDDSDASPAEPRRPAAAAEEVAARLASVELAGLRVGLLHGRLPADEKDRVMRAFAARELDVLVATTVIEVGVDVPNATVMVVLDADRFGVSQLHQLRGRVGRGTEASTCFLHTASWEGSGAGERLAAVAATTDGAALAEIDLRIRGEGDVLGAAQAGASRGVRLLRLVDDGELVVAARADAQRLVAEHPDLVGHPVLADAITRLLDAAAENVTFLEKG
jgi:ATP-dependent DNA helicase RecG